MAGTLVTPVQSPESQTWLQHQGACSSACACASAPFCGCACFSGSASVSADAHTCSGAPALLVLASACACTCACSSASVEILRKLAGPPSCPAPRFQVSALHPSLSQILRRPCRGLFHFAFYPLSLLNFSSFLNLNPCPQDCTNTLPVNGIFFHLFVGLFISFCIFSSRLGLWCGVHICNSNARAPAHDICKQP